MRKTIFAISLLLVFINIVSAQNKFPTINPENITIVRDTFGVPHIFAATDAEVAYGLAWVNAEDAFKEMQELLIIGKGVSGLNKGKDGAKADFFRHVIQAEETVKRRISELPEDYLRYLDGYAQGVNTFASKQPKSKLYKNAFPVTVEDLLVSYVVSLSFMTESATAMQKIYEGKFDEIDLKGLGSNAFALNSKKSTDQSTYLCINPHMQMNGTFSFYEVHLNSQEGLNMYGAIFHGGTSVFMGNNESLGWGMTWNHFSRGDIYKLQMNPNNKKQYMMDGKWEDLEEKKIKLKVKIAGLTIPVKKTSYWSKHHGPVLNSSVNKNAFYAFRYPAFLDIKAPMQWYRMNKTNNLTEFKKELDNLSISMFNIIYADKEDNIYYVSYGQVPYREDSIAQMEVVPGNKSEYIWQRLHQLNELPQEENPDCNYVYNTNNTPFFATCDENNNLKLELKKYLDKRPGQNNRATVLHDYLDSKEKISFEEFQAIKFNNTYSKESYLVKEMTSFFDIPSDKYPEISDVFNLLKNWDMVADTNSVSATVMMVAMDYIFKQKKFNDRQFITDFSMTEEDFISALRESKAWFLKHYGTIEVPLGKVFLAKKGNITFACPGFPDALAANYGKKTEEKFYAEHGDTYTQFVKFDKNGVKEMRTLVPFGNSYNPESPYYVNQSKLFQQQKTKAVTMDKATILKYAKEQYHPKH
jgi:acyl-homoserine-lactone acylase